MSQIQTVHRETTTDKIIEILEQDGAVIIESLNSNETMDQIQLEMDQYFQRSVIGESEFWGRKTKRFGALVAKSITFGKNCACNPVIIPVIDRLLGPHCDRFQLHVTMMVQIGPDEVPQKMHRDDGLLPFRHPGPQSLCNSMWAMTDFTKENGATNVILGSHKWPDDRLPSSSDEVVQATMKKGSCMLYVGSVWHGGALNRTKDQWRTGLICGYSLGWLRQEENMYLAVPPNIAKNLPEQLQHLIGYKIHGEFLGWVEAHDPHIVLEDHFSDVMLQWKCNLNQTPTVKYLKLLPWGIQNGSIALKRSLLH